MDKDILGNWKQKESRYQTKEKQAKNKKRERERKNTQWNKDIFFKC